MTSESPVVISASARAAIVMALLGRSAGFFASESMINLANRGSTVEGSGAGTSLIWAIAIAIWFSPVNGRLPAKAS